MAGHQQIRVPSLHKIKTNASNVLGNCHASRGALRVIPYATPLSSLRENTGKGQEHDHIYKTHHHCGSSSAAALALQAACSRVNITDNTHMHMSSGRRQSRRHLFTECRAWAPQIRRLWRRVGKDWVETPEGAVGKVVVEGRCHRGRAGRWGVGLLGWRGRREMRRRASGRSRNARRAGRPALGCISFCSFLRPSFRFVYFSLSFVRRLGGNKEG